MTVNGKYNPNLNLYRFINEPVEKKKLYKSGKSWLIASTTLFVLTTFGAVGANADANQTPVSATVPTEVVKNVNNQNISDNSLSTPVEANTANISNIQSDNSSSQSTEKTDNEEKSTSTNTTNQQPSEKPTAQNQVSNNAPSSSEETNNSKSDINSNLSNKVDNTEKSQNTVTDSNESSAAQVKDESSSSTNSIGNQATNLSVTDQSNPDGDLQKAIDDARNKGIIVNVNNKTVTVLSDGLSDEEKKIQAHYADEIDYIMQTENDYAAALQKAEDDYNKALADWKAKQAAAAAAGQVDPDSLTQNYHLGKSPDSQVQITTSNGVNVQERSPWGNDLDSQKAYQADFDGSQQSNTSENNPMVQATFTNINGSYTDPNTGITYKFSKRVDTWYGPSSNLKHLVINSDPTDGYWYYGDGGESGEMGVYHSVQYFDENGNPVNFDGNAYATTSSLNSSPDRREGVKIISGGTAKQIIGSSVSVQNGNDLSDFNNYNDDPSTWPKGHSWDSANSPFSYFGSGLVYLNGNKSIEYSYTDGNNIPPTWHIVSSTLQGNSAAKPVKEKVPAPKIDVDTTNINSVTPTPEKTATKDGQSIDGKNVERGDTIPYQISWDLTGLQNLEPNSTQIASGLSVTDHYDGSRVAPDKGLTRVLDADGNDITDQVDITWDDANSTVVFSAKDPNSFFNKYKGTKLTIDFPTTVMGDGDSDITNQAIQNTFGENNKTNIVINHQTKMDPKKDVVINAGSSDSLNGQDIQQGSNADYKISASRPGNYGGTTSEWSIVDTVPAQDEVTGQWQVYATSDITLADGTVISKGTDISKYFTFTIDRNTGKVIISANKDFLDLINSEINKKNEISWDAYFQIKRTGFGDDITNVAEESYNHQIVKTNKVTTKTAKPKAVESKISKPDTTKPEKPTIPQTVKEVIKQQSTCAKIPSIKESVREVVQHSSQPKKGTLPQTGETKNDAENIGIAILGLTGIMALLGLARKKKNKI